MSKSRKQSKEMVPAVKREPPARSAYVETFFPSQQECLDCFGKDKTLYQRTVVLLLEFMADWRSGVTEPDLNTGRWNLKALQGPEPKKYKIKQIKLMKDYRVALVVQENAIPPRICFLEVFLRGNTNERDFARAVARARRLLEEQQ